MHRSSIKDMKIRRFIEAIGGGIAAIDGKLDPPDVGSGKVSGAFEAGATESSTSGGRG